MIRRKKMLIDWTQIEMEPGLAIARKDRPTGLGWPRDITSLYVRESAEAGIPNYDPAKRPSK